MCRIKPPFNIVRVRWSTRRYFPGLAWRSCSVTREWHVCPAAPDPIPPSSPKGASNHPETMLRERCLQIFAVLSSKQIMLSNKWFLSLLRSPVWNSGRLHYSELNEISSTFNLREFQPTRVCEDPFYCGSLFYVGARWERGGLHSSIYDWSRVHYWSRVTIKHGKNHE